MGIKADTYSCLCMLSCTDNAGYGVQGRPVEEKVISEYDQVHNSWSVFYICWTGTQGTADYHEHHNIDQRAEGITVPYRSLSDGAVYIPLIYFHFSDYLTMGKRGLLRVVVSLWRHAGTLEQDLQQAVPERQAGVA